MSVNTPNYKLLLVFLVVVLALCVIAFQYPHPTFKAIDLVKNNYVDPYLTTGDMIKGDILSLRLAGVEAKAEWGAVDDSGGWYKVTVREQTKEFGEWVDFQIMQWRVNPDTKEIVALDNAAQAYLRW